MIRYGIDLPGVEVLFVATLASAVTTLPEDLFLREAPHACKTKIKEIITLARIRYFMRKDNLNGKYGYRLVSLAVDFLNQFSITNARFLYIAYNFLFSG